MAMTLFNMIGEPLDTIPQGIYGITEMVVSMGRISKFLNQEEVQNERLITNSEDYAIKIENTSFTWGAAVRDKKTHEEGDDDSDSDDFSENSDHEDNEGDGKNKIKTVKKGKGNKHAKKKAKISLKVKEEDNNENKDSNGSTDCLKNKVNNESDEIKQKLIINLDESSKSFIETSDNKEIVNVESQITIEDNLKNGNSKDKDIANIENNTSLNIDKNKKTKKNIRVYLKNINLEIKKGELIGVIGEVGSCKTTLLNAFLNNLLPINNANKAKYTNIIVNGHVSFISQTPWIRNETLRNNITFFKQYDKEKYNTILNICQLKQDLEMLSGRDLTEIGEKGINLSGGQKARVAIARALYSESDIFLFDDPISALDAHVGELLMKDCIINYLKGKTRILVTNAYQFLKYMDRVILMNEGEISFCGTYKELVEKKLILPVHESKEHKHNDESDSIENTKEFNLEIEENEHDPEIITYSILIFT